MREGEIKMPCMQDASPDLTQGFFFPLLFADRCDTLWRNSISIFLLHFKVAENNTSNGKMEYVSPPACYLSAPLPTLLRSPLPRLPAYMHTSFNSNRKSKWREKGKSARLEHFPCVSLGK